MEGFTYDEIRGIIENKKIPDIELSDTGKTEGIDYLMFDNQELSTNVVRPKQEIEAILTDFVTSELVAKNLDDPKQMNKYVRFLKLITDSFNKTIDRYKNMKQLKKNDIYFLYPFFSGT